jgi:hypothetical protein
MLTPDEIATKIRSIGQNVNFATCQGTFEALEKLAREIDGREPWARLFTSESGLGVISAKEEAYQADRDAALRAANVDGTHVAKITCQAQEDALWGPFGE